MVVKDQPIGKWLLSNAPAIFKAVSDAPVSKGVFRVIEGLIKDDDMLTSRQRRDGLEVLVQNEASAITDRWESDSESGWLSQNSRPLVVLFTIASFTALSMLESFGVLSMPDRVFVVWEVLVASVVGGYFGLRSLEKIKRKRK
jgi:hypothetical protein